MTTNSEGKLVDEVYQKAQKKKGICLPSVRDTTAREKAGTRHIQLLANRATIEEEWRANHEKVIVVKVKESQPSLRIPDYETTVLRLVGEHGRGFVPLKTFQEHNKEAGKIRLGRGKKMTINALRLTRLNFFIDLWKQARIKFPGGRKSDVTHFLDILQSSFKFVMVQGHDLRKEKYREDMEWVFVHPLFDPEDPDSIKKIVGGNIEKNPAWFLA